MRYIRYAINLVTAACFMLLNKLFNATCKLDDSKAMFISDVRSEIGGNLEYVADYMEQMDGERKFNITGSFKADRRLWSSPGEFIRMVKDMSTSRYIFLEDYYRYTSYFTVRPGQEIVQLWHGPGAFKKFGFSRADGNEKIKIHKGYKKYTKVITSAEGIRENYAEAFGVSMDRTAATGIPRTDLFYDKSYVEATSARLFDKYPELSGRKIILYAPTYRGTRADDAAFDAEKLPLDYIYEQLKDENVVFVFKWHPAIYNNIARGDVESYNLEKYNGFYMDLSAEREINDILMITDVLVTDYSSVIFDYYITGNPIVFYAYDLDTYYNGRSFYYPYEEYLFGPLVTEPSELVEALRNADLCEDKRTAFGQKFMSACDGQATAKTVKWVIGE